MWSHLFRNFIRSRIAVAGLFIILVCGIAAIIIGHQHLEKQQRAIQETSRFQQEHIKRNLNFFSKEIGLLMYYLKFGYVNQPEPLNGLFIGQRDVNSSISQVNIRGLENQRYDTDLVNPSNLLAGNLDLGFVIIYLFPLLIIAFCYNTLSEEKEEGTWPLVRLLSANPTNVLLAKLAIRAIVCFSAMYFLFGLACVVMDVPVNSRLVLAITVSSLYLLFWFAVCFCVMSFQANSSTNALSLLSLWILLTIIAPAMVNNFIQSRYPAPEALKMTVEQREGYHEKWDMDKKVTMDKFYTHYPQFSEFGVPGEQFSWLWYYAMQQMGDDDAEPYTKALRSKLMLRDKANRIISLFNPSMNTQYQLNRLAKADLANQVRYLDSLAAFHEGLRLQFYPLIFGNKPVAEVKWDQFKVVYFTDDDQPRWMTAIAPFIVFISICLIVGAINLRKHSFA